MRRHSKRNDFLSFFVSIVLHIGLVLVLALTPKTSRTNYESVNLSVLTKKTKPEPEPEPEPESEPELESEPEPEKPRKKQAPKPEPVEEEPPPLAPPPEEKVPEDAPVAPPVFDLSNKTFATGDGQSAGWSLKRSEGNTKFAPVAKKSQPSVRHTNPKGEVDGKPGGTGKSYAPVPIKDLSRRPKPRDGSVPPPAYPVEARREGIEGAVVLQVFIEKTGRVRRARVIKTPSESLAKVAKDAMLRVRWTPPLDKSGKPVDTVIIYSYRFVLDG